MKLLLIFCICLTVIVGMPQRGSYRKNPYKKLPRQGEVNVTTAIPPTTVSTTTTTESSIEEVQTEVIQEIVTSAPGVPPVFPASSTAENKPIAEPTKIPEVVASEAPPPPTATNQTKGEDEDDSSSEEEEDADDADARLLPQHAKPVALSAPANKAPQGGKAVRDPKLNGIVRGYISDTGEILVPISAFPQTFRYSVIDPSEINADDAVAASSEEATENLEDVEVQSEESGSPPKVTSAAVDAPKVPSPSSKPDPEAASASEETKPDSASAEEEEKVVSSETTDKPSAESQAVKTPPTSVFNPPPLAALPATKPTDEDDEEEAGGRRIFINPGPGGYYVNPFHHEPYYYEEADYDF